MPLFPLPAILGILVWLFVFFSSDWEFIVGALCIIVSGIILYFIKEKFVRVNNNQLE
jgi:hypothetical protein